MTQRERVIAAISHRVPDRVPFSWGLGITPEMTEQLRTHLAARGISFDELRLRCEHVLTVSPPDAGPELPTDTDIWGVKRRAMSYGTGTYDEIAHHPLAGVETVEVVRGYPFPTPDQFDFWRLREITLNQDPDRNKARRLAIIASGNPLERYTWMTGLEETMINLLLRPEVVHEAMSRITEFFIGMMRRAAESCGDLIDILYFADDLGGQQGILMSRDTYREMIMPYHARLTSEARRLMPHAKAMHHSDGSVFELLPDLIEAGVDILEAVQVDARLMEPERLKAAFGDRLAFHGAISVQSLLPHGDERTVRAEVKRLIATLGDGGGYVAAPSHAIQVGTPPENVLAMLETVLGEEEFSEAIEASRGVPSGGD